VRLRGLAFLCALVLVLGLVGCAAGVDAGGTVTAPSAPTEGTVATPADGPPAATAPVVQPVQPPPAALQAPPQAAPAPAPAPAPRSDVTVYVTKTGEKYHLGSCSYLRQSKIAISLSDAKSQGYGACSRCRPPQ
jgi:hypothetical protein